MPAKKKTAASPLSADVRPVRIGCVPLMDAAPLVAAAGLGIFAKHGVAVELCWELGWATVREGIHFRQLDCAHSPAGLVFAMRAGCAGVTTPVFTPFIFNLHGNAITLSTALWKSGVRDAATLGRWVRSQTGSPPAFAAVSKYSSHYFLLRAWLEQCGLNPDHDVRLVILPPRLMPECMAEGLIDGYCAGEPWNTVAVQNGTGWCPAVSSEIVPGHAEKVLLVHEDFARESPGRLAALTAALDEACRWCDAPANRPKLAAMMEATGHFPGAASIAPSLTGPFTDGTGRKRDAGTFLIFHRRDANRPTAERGAWVLQELIRHGVLPASVRRTELLQQCWREAA